MKRGFPRPRTMVGTLYSNPKSKRGGYRAKWNNREYPHPYTASDDNVAAIHDGRRVETVMFKRCGTCGEPVKDECVGLILYNVDTKDGKHVRTYEDWLHSESGPYHLKCLALNFAMCPHLSETDIYMAGYAKWSDVYPMIRDYQR
jgi:hypothetical protein